MSNGCPTFPWLLFASNNWVLFILLNICLKSSCTFFFPLLYSWGYPAAKLWYCWEIWEMKCFSLIEKKQEFSELYISTKNFLKKYEFDIFRDILKVLLISLFFKRYLKYLLCARYCSNPEIMSWVKDYYYPHFTEDTETQRN